MVFNECPVSHGTRSSCMIHWICDGSRLLCMQNRSWYYQEPICHNSAQQAKSKTNQAKRDIDMNQKKENKNKGWWFRNKWRKTNYDRQFRWIGQFSTVRNSWSRMVFSAAIKGTIDVFVVKFSIFIWSLPCFPLPLYCLVFFIGIIGLLAGLLLVW